MHLSIYLSILVNTMVDNSPSCYNFLFSPSLYLLNNCHCPFTSIFGSLQFLLQIQPSSVRVIFSYESDLRFWEWHCWNIIHLLHFYTFSFVCRRPGQAPKQWCYLDYVPWVSQRGELWIFFYQADPDWMMFISGFMPIICQIMNTPQMLLCYYAVGIEEFSTT